MRMYIHVYVCGKIPKNPLSIIFSYRRHHHVKFNGQENRIKNKTAFLGNKNQSETEIRELHRHSIVLHSFHNLS